MSLIAVAAVVVLSAIVYQLFPFAPADGELVANYQTAGVCLLACGTKVDLKNFDLKEFDSPDQPGSGKYMKPDTLDRLQVARTLAGIPFAINSGYRTPAHNKKVGGTSLSAHTRGHGVDIAANASTTRFKILKALIAAGFTRIGIGKGFIHADDDPTLPQEVAFHYYS